MQDRGLPQYQTLIKARYTTTKRQLKLIRWDYWLTIPYSWVNPATSIPIYSCELIISDVSNMQKPYKFN